jgi:hypothetical protein
MELYLQITLASVRTVVTTGQVILASRQYGSTRNHTAEKGVLQAEILHACHTAEGRGNGA